MYGFVDTTESAANTSLLSLTTKFNGVNLDRALSDATGSFTTLSVSGRDVPKRKISTIDILNDGVREGENYLEPKLITVKYRLRDKTNEGFRDRYNRLNGLLIGRKKVLEFTDEDAFFYSTVYEGDEIDEDSNDVISSLVFFCSDPNKYKPEKTITIDDTATETIGGHKPTAWKTKTTFEENQSGYELQFNSPGKSDLRDICKIKLNYEFVRGDVLEIDYNKRKVTVNGVDRSNILVILQSNYMELPVGEVEFEAGHDTELFYSERYY